MTVVLYALASEKAVSGIERENKLTLVVEKASTKNQVKAEVEKNYGHKVKSVNILVSPHGVKKAMVAFEKPGVALEFAAKLKVI
ncbi:MAG TPA: 50S ribosomal protein L23 [Candidatus Norongarragalinales archaeon]|nr:50S ribosomal protein L23 [Candidatus Norongarragalinales archaeon]